jgi:hypothetical protein
MSDTTNKESQVTEDAPKKSPAEIKEDRRKKKEHYDESITLLQSQLKYEKLVTEIRSEQYKRFEMDYRMTMMLAPDPEEKIDEKPKEKERVLKRAD